MASEPKQQVSIFGTADDPYAEYIYGRPEAVKPEPDLPDLLRADVMDIETRGKSTYQVFNHSSATDAILKKLPVAYGEDGQLYYWHGSIWQPNAESVLFNKLRSLAGKELTIHKHKEVIAALKNELSFRPVKFDPNPYLLGVENGVVDLRTGEMREYRPEDYITDQIDVVYDPAAKCPRFLQYLEDVAPNPTDRLMLIDWYAIHAVREMFPYILFLNGLGRNGKGIYERVLKRLFGEHSFSSMPLEELSVKNNRFAGADLAGKRGQIVSEAGGSQSKGKRAITTAFLKNATGDGIIDSDQKNKGRIKFKPFYKATIDSNDMPRIEDSSKGWIERFCKADLPYSYIDDPDPSNPLERKKDPKLFDKLTTPDELSGILNLILSRTPEIIKTGAITKRSGAEMFAEYQRQSNSVTAFLENFCGYNPVIPEKEDVALEVVFKAYQDWCDITVSDKVSDQRFGAAVKNLCNGIKSERIRGADGNRIRIYHGLTFDAKAYQSQVSQPVPTLSQQNKKQ